MATLIIDDGTGLTGNSYATTAQLDTYLSDRGYPAIATGKEELLIRSFDFMSFTSYCFESSETTEALAKLVKAQCEIARMINNDFEVEALADDKMLTEKGLGRGAITKKWVRNRSLSGSDGLSKLKRIPAAYMILKPMMCGYAEGLLAN